MFEDREQQEEFEQDMAAEGRIMDAELQQEEQEKWENEICSFGCNLLNKDCFCMESF